MSGPEIALVAVGVVALIAVAGVTALFVQTRRLRAELSAAAAATPPPTGSSDRTVARTPHKSEDPSAGGEALPAVRSTPPLQPTVGPSGSQVVSAVLGPQLVRAAALTYGVRRALTPENRDRVAALVRRDLRRRAKLRRHAARRAARVLPARSSDLSVAPAPRTSEDPSGGRASGGRTRRDLAS